MMSVVTESARVDKCGCPICEGDELIVVYFVRFGRKIYATDQSEHVGAIVQFIDWPVIVWTQLMKRSEYQLIPEPGSPSHN
jgi:hypothetical protein